MKSKQPKEKIKPKISKAEYQKHKIEYISPKTRAVIIVFTLYNIPSSYYTHVEIVFEFTPSG